MAGQCPAGEEGTAIFDGERFCDHMAIPFSRIV